MKPSNHGPGLNGQGVRNLDRAFVHAARRTGETTEATAARLGADLALTVDPLIEVIDRLRKDALNGDPMLRHFRYGHLPPHLRVISRKWAELAVATVQDVPRNAERTVALRKLLEGKDCAVRAILPED